MTALYIVNPDEPISLQKALLISFIGILTVLAELGLLTVIIRIISGFVRRFSKNGAENDNTPIPVPQAAAPAMCDPVLENVDEPDAAVIMALVSHQSGIPLSRLRFKSIKLVEEEEK